MWKNNSKQIPRFARDDKPSLGGIEESGDFVAAFLSLYKTSPSFRRSRATEEPAGCKT